MKDKLILASRSLRVVFSRPAYIILAIIIALIFFSASILVPKYELLVYIFTSGLFDAGAKFQIFWSLLTSLKTNFTLISIIFIIILSILFGINITTLIFYFKKRIASYNAAGSSILGMISGFLGIGCVSCGSVVLSAIFGFSATVTFLSFLPFGGLEFGVLGVFALFLSIYLIARKIQDPIVCKDITN
jgi:hypothetical protein